MILWLLSNTLQHVDFMNSKKLFLESLSKCEWLRVLRQALKKQLFMAILLNKLQNRKNGQTATIGLKPLPASPCQGRSGFGSPPDKGELEGVWVLGSILFPAHVLPRVCGAYLAQGERAYSDFP